MNEIKSREYALGDVSDLVKLVSSRFGYDLTSYKPSCLERRISVRKRALHIDSMAEYFGYICDNPEEIYRLIDTITIHTTRFFRDISSFDYLRNIIIPSIISDNKVHSLSIWSAGCSTGEETYSLAIIIHDSLLKKRPDLFVKIYGTDISPESCSIANRGLYTERSFREMPRSFLLRYFEREGNLFGVKEDIKKTVSFSVHDLIKDPPLEDIDIVVCRNVLIHFVQETRDSIIRKFNSSLKSGGYLILGKSEAITSSSKALFDLVDGRERVYRKKRITVPQGGKR